MTPRAFLCLALLLPALLVAQPQFGFEGEQLRFSLIRGPDPDTLVWIVSGDIYLSNLHHEALSRLIAFPVPSSAEIGSAENLELALVEPADSMAVELLAQGANGFSFRLDLPPRSFAQLRISYSQKISGKSAHYVLLTANSWGRPLPFCELTLLLEPDIELVELPFPEPDYLLGMRKRNLRSDNLSVYCWQFLDFTPDRDFIVRIK